MRKILIALYLTLIIISRIYAQDISFDANASEQEILTKLFEGRWDNTKKECIWKPNIAEKLQFTESYNGLLYTKIDTVFVYTNSYSKNIIVITTTNVKDQDGEYESCHACAPIMSIIELEYEDYSKKLNLRIFEKFVAKYGSYGEGSDLSLLQLAKDEYCVKVVDSYTSTGITEEITSLYYNGKKILDFTSYNGNMGLTEDESELFGYKTSLFLDKDSKRLFLIKKGTEMIYDDANGKLRNTNETTKYLFDSETGKLEKYYE